MTDLHNETVNIHTHFIGMVVAVLLIPLHLIPAQFPFTSDPVPTPPTLHDKVALTLNLLCAVSCFGLSSFFHTVQCHSKATCDAAHRGDYVSRHRPTLRALQLMGRWASSSLLPGPSCQGCTTPSMDSLFSKSCTWVRRRVQAAVGLKTDNRGDRDRGTSSRLCTRRLA